MTNTTLKLQYRLLHNAKCTVHKRINQSKFLFFVKWKKGRILIFLLIFSGTVRCALNKSVLCPLYVCVYVKQRSRGCERERGGPGRHQATAEQPLGERFFYLLLFVYYYIIILYIYVCIYIYIYIYILLLYYLLYR